MRLSSVHPTSQAGQTLGSRSVQNMVRYPLRGWLDHWIWSHEGREHDLRRFECIYCRQRRKFSPMMFSGVWAEAGQSYCGSQINRQLSLIGRSYLSARYHRQQTYLSVPITDHTVNGGGFAVDALPALKRWKCFACPERDYRHRAWAIHSRDTGDVGRRF